MRYNVAFVILLEGRSMPIYEYECEICGHQLEAFQKISEPPLADCAECQKPKLKKLISAAGFRLTGSGWYETDFKHGGKPKEKNKSSEPKASSKVADSGSSNKKSEASSKPSTTPSSS